MSIVIIGGVPTDVGNGAGEIITLRQRVAELEADLELAKHKNKAHDRELERVIAERDKATQYWQIAEGRCDALIKQRDELLAALYVITKRPVIEAFSIAEAAIASVKEERNASD